MKFKNKTTMEHDFTPTRMAKLKRMSNNKNCQIQQSELHTCLNKL